MLCLALCLGGCQRTYVIEDLRPGGADVSREVAHGVLGKESRVFRKWGEVVSLQYTSCDVYHKGEASWFDKVVWDVLLPFRSVLGGPVFGLPEVVEATFSSGRVWKKEMRRRWFWFVPLSESPASEYCDSLVRLHGSGEAGQAPE